MPSAALLLRSLLVLTLASGVFPVALESQCPDGSPREARGCRGRTRVDTNAILVLPFAVTGAPSAEYLGRSMVDLFHMALNGVGQMRIEYAPGVLERTVPGSDPTNVQRAAGGALELGIGRIIGGSIVAVGPDIRIRAQVFDAERNRVQFEVTGRARLENVGVVVDSLATQILARRAVPAADRGRVSIAEYATRSAQALQAYLVGRQHMRAFERRAAADSARSALKHDPDFGLAWLLLHRLEASEGGVTGIPRDTVELMVRAHRDRFPPRVRDIFDEARFGNRMQRRAWVATLLARYPHDPDAAFYNADQFFHNGINLGESHATALQAFRRAYELDDSDPELVGHYGGLLSEAGDSTALRDLEAAECRRLRRTDCRPSAYYRAVFRGEDPLTMDIAHDTLLGVEFGNFIVRGAAFDPAFGIALSDSFAQRQLKAPRRAEQRAAAWLLRAAAALGRGQHARASAWLDSALAIGPRPAYVLLHHIATGDRGDEAAAIAREEPPRGSIRSVNRAWWAAATQTADVALSMLPSIEQPREPVGTRAFTNGLQGLIALRGGDTTRALELFEKMRPDRVNPTSPSRLLFPGSYLALVHARLEASRGNYPRARLYLADVYPLNEYVPFVGEAEELRGEVALALGDTVGARRHLGNFVALWRDADSRLQPRVARARDRLAQLRR